MSEPTKEQLAEAQKLGHDHGCLIEMDCTQEHGDAFSLTTESLARIIARVRTQATNDTLEIVANVAAQYPIAAFPENSSSVDASSARMARLVCKVIADDLRAMKVPT